MNYANHEEKTWLHNFQNVHCFFFVGWKWFDWKLVLHEITLELAGEQARRTIWNSEKEEENKKKCWKVFDLAW